MFKLIYLWQYFSHLERSDRIHIGGHNWNAIVGLFGIAESNVSMQIDLLNDNNN